MNESLILNFQTLTILVGGVFILGFFAGFFCSSYLSKENIIKYIDENQMLKDYFHLISNKIKGFEKMKQHEYHNILKSIQDIIKPFK